MGISIRTGSPARWTGCVGRGVAWLAAVGFVVGGLAGTIDWPFVGTFFGAVEGAGFGAVTGVLVGAVLAFITASTRSRPTVRLVSAVLAGVGTLAGAGTYPVPSHAPRLIVAALVVAAMVVAAAGAPLIAYGTLPAPTGVGRRILVGGAVAGAGAGAVVGLILGVRSYPPTAPVAAVEGAVLGAVSGLVLACLVAGVTVVPRLRARR